MTKSTYGDRSTVSACCVGKYPPHTIDTCGSASRTRRQTATACVSCGPGITVTASSAKRDRVKADRRATISAAGSGTTLPSTSAQASPLVSSTAASAISDSGSGCFPGVVDSGL